MVYIVIGGKAIQTSGLWHFIGLCTSLNFFLFGFVFCVNIRVYTDRGDHTDE